MERGQRRWLHIFQQVDESMALPLQHLPMTSFSTQPITIKSSRYSGIFILSFHLGVKLQVSAASLHHSRVGKYPLNTP